jgi:hypothetical protein
MRNNRRRRCKRRRKTKKPRKMRKARKTRRNTSVSKIGRRLILNLTISRKTHSQR